MLKTFFLGVILIFINIGLVNAQVIAKQDPISKITEVTPDLPIYNTFAYLSEVHEDISKPALYKKKGSPAIGVIYISLLSKEPIIYNGTNPPKYIDLYINNEKIKVRFILSGRDKTRLGYEENFILLFDQGSLRNILKSTSTEQIYFILNGRTFIINELIREQLVLIKKAGLLL